MNPTPERTEKTPIVDGLSFMVHVPTPFDPQSTECITAFVGRKLEKKLNAALEQNEALRGALEGLLAWSDTMRVAYEHPFLNDTAIHNARKTLSTPPAKA